MKLIDKSGERTTTFLECLETFLIYNRPADQSEVNKAMTLLRRASLDRREPLVRDRTTPLRASGPCLLCGEDTPYGRPAAQHSSWGNSWLDRLFREWKTPFEISFQGQQIQINGKGKDEHWGPYCCPACRDVAEQMEDAQREKLDQAELKRDEDRVEWSYAIYCDENQTNRDRFNAIDGFYTNDNYEELKSLRYKDFLETKYWKIVRMEILKRAGFKCSLCDKNGRLNVHHKTYEHHGQEHRHLSDLIALCGTCHATFHGKLENPADTVKEVTEQKN